MNTLINTHNGFWCTLSTDAISYSFLIFFLLFFPPHLQYTRGSIWQHLDRQHPRTRSHLLVDELLLGARLQQPRVWSQHHLCSIVQTCRPTLHLNSASHTLEINSECQLHQHSSELRGDMFLTSRITTFFIFHTKEMINIARCTHLHYQPGKAAGQHARAEVPRLGGAAAWVWPPQHQRLKTRKDKHVERETPLTFCLL